MSNESTIIGIGIQKDGGHLFGPTADALRKAWGLDLNRKGYSSGKEEVALYFPAQGHSTYPRILTPSEWAGGAPVNATLLPSRLEDIIQDIAEGDLDIGFVSSDALTHWNAANGEITHQKDITVKDIGFAGSHLKIGVSQAFMNTQENASIDQAWRNAVIESYKNQIPIFTSFPNELRNFLETQALPVPSIKVRQGGIEARAKRRSLVIADLTASGSTMKRNGFMPVEHISIFECRLFIVARTPELDSPRRPLAQNLLSKFDAEAPQKQVA